MYMYIVYVYMRYTICNILCIREANSDIRTMTRCGVGNNYVVPCRSVAAQDSGRDDIILIRVFPKLKMMKKKDDTYKVLR